MVSDTLVVPGSGTKGDQLIKKFPFNTFLEIRSVTNAVNYCFTFISDFDLIDLVS